MRGGSSWIDSLSDQGGRGGEGKGGGEGTSRLRARLTCIVTAITCSYMSMSATTASNYITSTHLLASCNMSETQHTRYAVAVGLECMEQSAVSVEIGALYITPHCVGSTPHHTVLALHRTTLCCRPYTAPHCAGPTPHHTVLALHHTTLCCRLYTTPHCVGSTPHHTVLQALHHTTLCWLYTTPHCVGSTPHHTVLQALHHTTLYYRPYTTPHCIAGPTPHHTVLQTLHHTTLCCRTYLVQSTGHVVPCSGV